MEHGSHSPEHLTDADLLEGLLGRESPPHLAGCARCATRAETIARHIDPLRTDPSREPFDTVAYQRQAASIRAGIAAGEGSWLPFRFPPTRLAWAAAAVAAVLTIAVGLRVPALLGRRAPGGAAAVVRTIAAGDARRALDRADDRLLRDIDDLLDEDPYVVDLGDG